MCIDLRVFYAASLVCDSWSTIIVIYKERSRAHYFVLSGLSIDVNIYDYFNTGRMLPSSTFQCFTYTYTWRRVPSF